MKSELKTKKVHLTFDDAEGLDISDTYEPDLITITILGNPVDVKVSDLIKAINEIKGTTYAEGVRFNFGDYQTITTTGYTYTDIGTNLNGITDALADIATTATTINAQNIADVADGLRYYQATTGTR